MEKPKEKVEEPTAPVRDRLDEARELSKKMTEQNDRYEKLVERQEKVAADNALGGVTQAGQPAPVAKVETNKEYRARIEKELAEGKHV